MKQFQLLLAQFMVTVFPLAKYDHVNLWDSEEDRLQSFYGGNLEVHLAQINQLANVK